VTVRRAALLGLLAVTVCASGCVKTVKVAKPLKVEAPLTLDDLVGRVKSLAQVNAIQSTVSIQFRDLRGATEGKNKQYPAGDANLVLERPELIRLRIKVPVVGKTIADMVSDGTKFKVKVLYPEDKRQFLMGSNAGRYKRVEAGMQTSDPTLQRAGALANIRPQHLTDAFLIQPPLLDAPNGIYYLDEAQETEHAGKDGDVIRTYYVLTLLERVGTGSEGRVVRRLWFERSWQGTPLAKQELYEDGRVATSIRYENYMPLSDGRTWPLRVSITRVEDSYSVDVIFTPKTLTINGDVPKPAFELDNDEHLPVVDLDKRTDVLEPGNGGEH
jgi:hypothetical protein